MRRIVMTVNDFIKEHKHLLKVLRTGSKSERNKEADKQLKELKKKMKTSQSPLSPDRYT